MDEGLRSKLRSNLNRRMRSAKGYTKSGEMLEHLLAMVFDECLFSHSNPLALQGENTDKLERLAQY